MRHKVNSHSGNIIDSKNGYEIMDCNICGFKHIYPVPSSDDLEKIYKEEYYSTEKPQYLKKSQSEKDWLDIQCADKYETIESFLTDHSSKTLLDIGSGPGNFIAHGANRGWAVKGIEPSKQAYEFSKSLGLNVVNDFFNEESALSIGMFDVVHANNVLEHIPDPIKFIELASTILKDNGLLCIVVPNDYNPFQMALREHDSYEAWWLAPPHHINYFDHSSLSNLLERKGFEILYQEGSFPIDLFLLMGDNYTKDSDLGSQCHKKRMRMELLLKTSGNNHLRRELYKKLANLNIGREVCIFARKK